MRYTHVCGEHVASAAAALVHLLHCPREAYYERDGAVAKLTRGIAPPPSLDLVPSTWRMVAEAPLDTRIARVDR